MIPLFSCVLFNYLVISCVATLSMRPVYTEYCRCYELDFNLSSMTAFLNLKHYSPVAICYVQRTRLANAKIRGILDFTNITVGRDTFADLSKISQTLTHACLYDTCLARCSSSVSSFYHSYMLIYLETWAIPGGAIKEAVQEGSDSAMVLTISTNIRASPSEYELTPKTIWLSCRKCDHRG